MAGHQQHSVSEFDIISHWLEYVQSTFTNLDCSHVRNHHVKIMTHVCILFLAEFE